MTPRRAAGYLLLLAIACVAAYLPALGGPFTFDDIRNIVENPHVHMTRVDLPSVARALTPYESLNLRPLSFLSFALNHRFGGLDPAGFRAVNIAVLLCSLPVAYLLGRTIAAGWFRPEEARALALGATALWALHPILTNGVSYIVQRMTSLYVLLSMAALLLFAEWRRTHRRLLLALSGVAFLGSLAAKETALFTPLLALAMLWVLPRERGGAGRAAGWLLLASVAASQLATAFAVRLALAERWIPPSPVGPVERLLTEGRAVVRYLGLFALPLPSRLVLDYDFPVSTSLLSPPSTLAAWSLVGALAVGAARWRAQVPLAALGVLGFLILQLPEGTFLPLDLVFEHRAYFPAYFLALAFLGALAGGLRLAGARRPVFAALATATVLAAAAGTLTWQRNHTWADQVRLWEDTVAKAPGNARAHLNLAARLSEAGRHEEALGHLRTAIALKPRYQEAHLGLSRSLRELGRHEEALGHARTAWRIKADNPAVNDNLGMTLAAGGDPGQAEAYFREAVRLKPDYAEALSNLAGVLGMLGRHAEALESARRAVAVRPDYGKARYNLGVSLLRLGRRAEAAAVARELERSEPWLARRLREQAAGVR